MANVSSMVYWNPSLEVADCYEMCLSFTRTQATAEVWAPGLAIKLTPIPVNNAILTILTPIVDREADPVTQERIDNFLGNKSEFLATQFRGQGFKARDAMGFIVNMGGQCREVIGTQAINADDDGIGGGAQSKAKFVKVLTIQPPLPDPIDGTKQNEIAVGAFGNIAVTYYHQALSGIKPPGVLSLRIFWRSK